MTANGQQWFKWAWQRRTTSTFSKTALQA